MKTSAYTAISSNSKYGLKRLAKKTNQHGEGGESVATTPAKKKKEASSYTIKGKTYRDHERKPSGNEATNQSPEVHLRMTRVPTQLQKAKGPAKDAISRGSKVQVKEPYSRRWS